MKRETLTTLANEEWRPVKGYEGWYEVSNLGRVISLRTNKILKQKNTTLGYRSVHLHNYNRKSNTKFVHRLVAIAFITNPDNLPEVNHKDENKANNRADNLEWCDRSYNINYGTGIKRRTITRSEHIEQLTLEGKHVAYYMSSEVAGELNSCSPSQIRRVIRGERDSAFGYLWRAIEGSIDGLKFETEPREPIGKKPTKVEQLTLDGKHVAYYESMSAAAKAVSCSIQNIYNAIICINKTVKGYKWRSIEKIVKPFSY